MQNKFNFSLFFACTALFWSGCDTTPQSVPSYVYIPAITVQPTNPSLHGATTSKIIDAWVYVNDNLVGGFRLPATVPIISDGKARVSVLAGIAENGTVSTPSVYPFYERYDTNFNFIPGHLDTLKPIVKYYTATSSINKFFIADFEQDNKFTAFPDNLTDDVAVTIGGSAGNQYGRIILTDSLNKTLCGSTERISPDLSRPTWLEMDYKGTNRVVVGIIGYSGVTQHKDYVNKVILLPKANWTKIYIAFSVEMTALKEKYGTTSYQVVLYGAKDPSTGVSSEINVDNIKVLYY
jgi:hypothetical protein